jgi:putative transposase
MSFALGVGSRITVDNKTLVFTQSTAAQARVFRDEVTGEVLQLSDTEVFKKWLEGNATLNFSRDPGLDDVLVADFTCFPERDKQIAMRRQEYVRAIMVTEDPRPQSIAWKEVIGRVAASMKDSEPPAWQTVRPWVKAYKESNHDIRSLLPRYRRCGRKRIDRTAQEEGFLKALLSTWLTTARITRKKFYGQVEAAYALARKKVPGALSWKEPSKSWLRRALDRLDAREVVARRYGEKAASDMFDHGGTTPEASFPLQVVEIDHTRLNLNVVDPTRKLLLGRPWITAAIDRYTRMLVGIYIGFEPPSVYSVQQCLKNAILPKDWLNELWPDMAGRWEAYGIPILVLVDNGVEFKSGSFKEIGAALDMTIRLAPVRLPTYKGVVERFFRTIEDCCLSGLPGRTFSNPQVKGDYDAEKAATLTLEDFRKYFHFWMLAEYVWKVHSEILALPGMRWRQALRTWNPGLPKSRRDLDVVLSRRDTAKLTKRGVVFKRIRYQSDELQALYRAYPKDRNAILKVDDGDLGKLYVIHSKSPVPVPAAAVNQKYAKGLMLFSHLQILKIIDQRNARLENSKEALDAKQAHFVLYNTLLRASNAKNRAKLARSIADSTIQPNFDLFDSIFDHVSPEARSRIDAEMLALPQPIAPEPDREAVEENQTTAKGKKPAGTKRRRRGDDEDDDGPDAPEWSPGS